MTSHPVTYPADLPNQFTYTVVIADCLSTGNQGSSLVKRLFEQFPYANVYQNRLPSSMPSPGNFELVGKGTCEQPYIIIAYGQIYPSNASFPNDNPRRRQQWLTQICRKMTAISNIHHLILPDNLLPYQLQCFDNFLKKYYLTSKQKIAVYDYQGQPLFVPKDRADTTSTDVTDNQALPKMPPYDKYNIIDIIPLEQLYWKTIKKLDE